MPLEAQVANEIDDREPASAKWFLDLVALAERTLKTLGELVDIRFVGRGHEVRKRNAGPVAIATGPAVSLRERGFELLLVLDFRDHWSAVLPGARGLDPQIAGRVERQRLSRGHSRSIPVLCRRDDELAHIPLGVRDDFRRATAALNRVLALGAIERVYAVDAVPTHRAG